jgi:hypothetical protein
MTAKISQFEWNFKLMKDPYKTVVNRIPFDTNSSLLVNTFSKFMT